MLDILRELWTDMQSMSSLIGNLEQSQDSLKAETFHSHDPSQRWADYMDGVNVPMYTDLQCDDQEEDKDKENENTHRTNLLVQN